MSMGQTGHTPGGVPPNFFLFIVFFSLSPIQERGNINLRKSLGHRPGVPVICYRKTEREKGIFAGTPAGNPAIQGVQKF